MSPSVPLPPDAMARLRMLEKAIDQPQDSEGNETDQNREATKD